MTGASIPKSIMHIAYLLYFRKIYKFPPSYFRTIYEFSPIFVHCTSFCLICVFSSPISIVMHLFIMFTLTRHPVWRKVFVSRGLGILFSIWLLQNMRFTKAENVLHLAWNVKNRVGFWGSAPDPLGAYDAPPDHLVVRGVLPSAIAASRLRRLQFSQLGPTMIKKFDPPPFRGEKSHTV